MASTVEVSMQDIVLEAFEAAGAEAGLVYLTVPITSGRREFTLLRELGCTREELRTRFRDRWLRDVVRPNEDEARLLAQLTRTTYAGQLVVDPSRLHVTEWTQDDFDKLWTLLIERYARLVVVSPHWAFSRGARLEVGLAVALGIPLADPLGNPLASTDLTTMAAEAEAELADAGWGRAQTAPLLPPLPAEHRDAVRATPPPPAPFERAAMHVFAWLAAERHYQVNKFGTDLDDEHTRQGLQQDGWWWRQLTNYFGRAHVLTLDNPVGRQALAKFTATACGLLESAVRVHGDLPAPGLPSGEIRMHASSRST